MGRPTTWSIVETFQEKADIKDEAVRKALGLNPELIEAFWAGLNAMSKKTGSVIPNFERVLGASGASLLKKLVKKGAIKEHSSNGELILTTRMIGRMSDVIKLGNATHVPTNGKGPGLVTKPKRATKAVAGPAPPPSASPATDAPADTGRDVSSILANVKLSDIAEYVRVRLAQIDSETGSIKEECGNVIDRIVRERDEKIEALQQERERFMQFVKSITGQV